MTWPVRWLVLVLLTLTAPAAARAADTVIDFESPAAGTTITDQYADVGGTGQGVVFGPLPGGAEAGSTYRPALQAAAGQAFSGIQLANLYPPGEGGLSTTTGTFSVPRKRVSVYVGYLGEDPVPQCTAANDTDNSCARVTLSGYDSSGAKVVTSQPALLTSGAGLGTLLTIQRPSAEIVGFYVTARESVDNFKPIGIDDLAFDIPETPAPADFTLSTDTASPVVRQGQTITATIAIGRLSGSTGDVALALGGTLPPGIEATIAPNPAGGIASVLTITAEPGAQPTGSEPIALTVTGTPSSSATGSAPRAVTLNLRVRQAFDVRASGPADVDLSACNVRVPFLVTRDFSLAGPVGLSVTGMANGVTASVTPAQATFAGGAAGETVHVAVVAPATGEPVPATTLTIHAFAPPLAERTATVTVHGTCPAQYDAQVTSLQITQGTQSRFLPARDGIHAAVIGYDEIANPALLRAGGPTVVRAYADNNFGPAEGVARVPMVLAGYSKDVNGTPHPLPGSPLLPNGGPRTLKNGAIDPTIPEMESDTGAYTFTLPPEWTRGRIGISAQLQPALPPARPVSVKARAVLAPGDRAVTPCVTADCRLNDYMALTQIPFYGAPSVTIRPLEMRVGGVAMPDPETVFAMTRLTTPLAIRLLPYQAVIDISDIAAGSGDSDARNSAVVGRVHDWVCDNGDFAIGVNPGAVARGLFRSGAWCWSQLDTINSAVVAKENPLISVAHEWYHSLGRLHASPGCGGGANGQRNEPWPPDEVGYLQSVGLNTTLGSGTNGAPYDVIPGSPGVWYDLMGYCAAQTGKAWISVHNWNAVMNDRAYLRAGPAAARRARPRAGAPRTPSLVVSASVSSAGETAIQSVTALAAPAQPASSSAYRLVASDAEGRVLADVAMLESADHVDRAAPAIALTAAVPAAGVVAVAIVRDGVTLATRRSSASAPTVAGVRARGGSVRWRSADADADARFAVVDYSADGGRRYRRIFEGPDRGRVDLPARLLSRAARARVRVTVDDGFRSATAVSPVFRAAGAPPTVRIVSPRAGVRQPNDATLLLSGEAFDDAGRALTGKRLRWMLGRRLLGRGAQIGVAGLPPGARRIVLVARDRAGRRGRAGVRVNLAAARPLFLSLAAPKAVKRSARALRLRVSASLRSRLTVRGRGLRTQRFRAGRDARRVRVAIPRGRRALALRLTLRAGGRSRAIALSVARR